MRSFTERDFAADHIRQQAQRAQRCAMGLEVAGSTAVGKQPDLVAHFCGIAHGMLDRELRREAYDIHALDRKFAEPPLQAGPPEGAVAIAGDEDFSTAG